MIHVTEAAGYLCSRYEMEYGEQIDEMKLHKLMYFAQRESLIQTGEPLFDAEFRGWKYGPVLTELRKPYQENRFPVPDAEAARAMAPVMDTVFTEYAGQDSFSLSRLTHGEISWRRSRKGIAPAQVSNNPMTLADIRLDAARVLERREMLRKQGLL